MYYTKKQLIQKISKKYQTITELQENEKMLVIQADNFKFEVKKVWLAKIITKSKNEMVLMYQY